MEVTYLWERKNLMDILIGTPVLDMDTPYLKDKYVILDIGVEGAREFKQKHKNSISVYVTPSSEEEVLQQMQTKYPSELNSNKSQLKLSPQVCDWLVINDDPEQAASEIERIMCLAKENSQDLESLDEETLKFLFSYNFHNPKNREFVENFYGKEREGRLPGD